MDPLTTPPSDHIIMPPVPPTHRSHLKLEITAGIVLVIAVVVASFVFLGNPFLKMSQRVALVGTATTTVYLLSGTTLSYVSATPTENQLGGKFGAGSTLGKLPDGALLALTPLGLSKVMPDGTTFQLLHAGGTSSVTPLGTASTDLTRIAFVNRTTGTVDVYHFNPATLEVARVGTVQIPVAASTASSTAEMLSTLATTTDGAYTPEALNQLRSWSAVEGSRAMAASRPASIGLVGTTIVVLDQSGRAFSFTISDTGVGSAQRLTLVSNKE